MLVSLCLEMIPLASINTQTWIRDDVSSLFPYGDTSSGIYIYIYGKNIGRMRDKVRRVILNGTLMATFHVF